MASNSSPKSESASPSPNDRYFCHRCVREVENINQDAFTCPFCNQGFLEQISSHEQDSHDEEQPDQGNAAAQAADFNEFFRNVALPLLFPGARQGGPPGAQAAANYQGIFGAGRGQQGQQGQQQQQPGQQQFGQQQPGQPPQQGPWFLQNLLEGLIGGGAFQFEVQINDGQPQQIFGSVPLHGNPGDYAWGPGGLDEIVTRLLNQFEGGAPPLSEEQIRNLPQAEISQDQVDKRLQCTVCMDDFKLKETVRRLPCGHHFHDACIIPWLGRHNTCPVCRKAAAEVTTPNTGSGSDGGFGPGSGSSGGFSGTGNRQQPGPGSSNQQAWDAIEELD